MPLSFEKLCGKALAGWANAAIMMMLLYDLMAGYTMSNLNVLATRDKMIIRSMLFRSYLLTVLAVAGILALRLSKVVKASSLVWEDGSIFLTGALSGSLWKNMLTPYAGYYHLIPRLVAQYATVYNLPSVPVFYITSSIVFASLMLALPVLPVFSGLISLRWRIVLALLCALIPAFTEVFGNIAHLHWFALWGLTLFSFADLSKISSRWLVVAIPLLFASAYSSAPAFVLIPLYGLQAYRFRAYWVATVFSFAFILFASSYVLVCARLKEASSFSSLSLSDIAVYTSKTVGFKSILVPLIGQRFSSVLQISWLSIAAFIFASILLLVAAWRSGSSSRYGDSYCYLAQCYSIVAFVVIVPIMRPFYVNHFLVQGYWDGADRYYMIPAFLLLLCLLQFLSALACRLPSRLLKLSALLLVTIYLVPISCNFRMPAPWIKSYSWSRDVRDYYQKIVSNDISADASRPYAVRVYPGEASSAMLPPTGSFTEEQREKVATLLR